MNALAAQEGLPNIQARREGLGTAGRCPPPCPSTSIAARSRLLPPGVEEPTPWCCEQQEVGD